MTPRYARQLGDEGKKAVAQGDKLASSDKVTPAARDSLHSAGADLRAALTRLDAMGT